MIIGVGVAVGVGAGVVGCGLTVMQAAAIRVATNKPQADSSFFDMRKSVPLVWHAICEACNCIKHPEPHFHSPIVPFLSIRPTQNC